MRIFAIGKKLYTIPRSIVFCVPRSLIDSREILQAPAFYFLSIFL